MTPLFWGGRSRRYGQPESPASTALEGRFKTANHKRYSEADRVISSRVAALLDLAMPYPPLCVARHRGTVWADH